MDISRLKSFDQAKREIEGLTPELYNKILNSEALVGLLSFSPYAKVRVEDGKLVLESLERSEEKDYSGVDLVEEIFSGAGWCTEGYLINIAAWNYSSSALKEAAIELAIKGRLYEEEQLTEDELSSSEEPSKDKRILVRDAKELEF